MVTTTALTWWTWNPTNRVWEFWVQEDGDDKPRVVETVKHRVVRMVSQR